MGSINEKKQSKLELKNGEKIAAIFSRSLYSYAWQLIFSLLFLIVPYFFLYPLMVFGLWTIAGFIIIELFALIWLIRIFICRNNTSLIVTNYRLIKSERAGFFKADSETMILKSIGEAKCLRKGLMYSILGLGDISLEFNNREVGWKFGPLKNCQLALNLISEQYEMFSEFFSRKSQAEIMLHKIKKKLGEEKFRQLISD